MPWTLKLKSYFMVKTSAVLLDTHILLWWLTGDQRFDPDLKDIISSPDVRLVCSVVSLWEMSIKEVVGKIRYPHSIQEVLKRNNVEILPVLPEHVEQLRKLPMIHKDPFDRMLIAQAQVEQMVLITHDKQIAKYKVKQMLS